MACLKYLVCHFLRHPNMRTTVSEIKDGSNQSPRLKERVIKKKANKITNSPALGFVICSKHDHFNNLVETQSCPPLCKKYMMGMKKDTPTVACSVE